MGTTVARWSRDGADPVAWRREVEIEVHPGQAWRFIDARDEEFAMSWPMRLGYVAGFVYGFYRRYADGASVRCAVPACGRLSRGRGDTNVATPDGFGGLEVPEVLSGPERPALLGSGRSRQDLRNEEGRVTPALRSVALRSGPTGGTT